MTMIKMETTERVWWVNPDYVREVEPHDEDGTSWVYVKGHPGAVRDIRSPEEVVRALNGEELRIMPRLPEDPLRIDWDQVLADMPASTLSGYDPRYVRFAPAVEGRPTTVDIDGVTYLLIREADDPEHMADDVRDIRRLEQVWDIVTTWGWDSDLSTPMLSAIADLLGMSEHDGEGVRDVCEVSPGEVVEAKDGTKHRFLTGAKVAEDAEGQLSIAVSDGEATLWVPLHDSRAAEFVESWVEHDASALVPGVPVHMRPGDVMVYSGHRFLVRTTMSMYCQEDGDVRFKELHKEPQPLTGMPYRVLAYIYNGCVNVWDGKSTNTGMLYAWPGHPTGGTTEEARRAGVLR